MNKILLRQCMVASMVMGLMVSQFGWAAKKSAESPHYFWYDGDEKRSVWVNPTLMVEFKPQVKMRTQLKSRYGAKEIDTQSSFVRFWEIESDASISLFTRSLNQGMGARFSPILYDSVSISGTKRALPGNILVQMKPEWSQKKIEDWFDERDLIVIKPINFIPNTFLIQIKSGLNSLHTANRVYETGDVLLASPNWWQEMVAR